MTMHRIIVLSLLAVTTVLTLLYVSTFPVEGGNAPARIERMDRLESEKPSRVPAGGVDRPIERAFDTEASRSVA